MLQSLPKKRVDQLAKDKLPQGIHEAVGKIELVIEARDSTKLLHVRATRHNFQVSIQWGKVFAFLVSLYRLWF